MRYDPVRKPGTEAICLVIDVFLNGTGAETHAVVEIAMWPAKSATAPAPIAAVCRSGTPHTTGVPAGSDGRPPNAAAQSAESGPSTDPVERNGGRRDGSRPARVTKVSWYATGAP